MTRRPAHPVIQLEDFLIAFLPQLFAYLVVRTKQRIAGAATWLLAHKMSRFKVGIASFTEPSLEAQAIAFFFNGVATGDGGTFIGVVTTHPLELKLQKPTSPAKIELLK